jgi:hypothetical protein
MPQIIKRFLSRISPKTRVVALTLLAAIAVGVGVAWVVARATQPATSQETGPAAIIPLTPPLTPPFVKPSALATPLTEEQRSLEPPPGALPTPSAALRNGATANTRNVPEGWVVYDNPKFQYTFALPPDWQTDMKPEGGYFQVSNPADLASNTAGTIVPGGVAGHFVGMLRIAIGTSVTDHLAQPNAFFGDYPGAIWEGLKNGEKGYGIANIVRFAFARGDLVFYGAINLGEEGYSDSNVKIIYQIFNTITPY